MKPLRWSLLLGYVLATMLAQFGHDHGIADADTLATEAAEAADCRESRSHLHEHPGASADLKADDCLACKVQSQQRLFLPSRLATAQVSTRLVAIVAPVSAVAEPILRASSRAPPLA